MNQTANPWHAATSSSNIKSTSNQHQPLPLQNKYSVLRVADEENLEMNEDVAAKQATEICKSTRKYNTYCKTPRHFLHDLVSKPDLLDLVQLSIACFVTCL